ncbi:MAG: hypothetical protein NZ570_04950 [Candidatus Caldarchaeum sp.]|nr:hypothetical protein [Candidatus Caldarchaeum sp.]MCS7136955.1 hypothetical protein [Candidatus Caldarchaeum sp.]MDW8359020.1 hypothetical protein [Candidatus Caldarchaeum sp.]
MTAAEKPTAAFILSLVAGVLILAGGLFGVAAWMMWDGMAYWGGWGGMMGPMMMGWWMPWAWSAFSLLGLVSGIAIIAGALMLQSHPAQAQTWGTVILVFSVVSVFGMGGFLLGALLGILGGILALTWKLAQTRG